MAVPFKRLCRHAARSSIPSLRHQRHERRPFSRTALHHRASPTHDDLPFPPPLSSSVPSNSFSDPDPVYEDDDISSLGHAELEQHRELREMARIAAWEMPQLVRFHKPYDHEKHRGVLRWRYTTYMGEQHPAANKVVVTFKPAELTMLDEAQRAKFLKLVGARYNAVTGVVRMSCESFETQAMNKRYLADTVRALVEECRDPSADTFEDVPLDTRHVKLKARPKFPERWLVTEERRAELDAKRRQSLVEEGERVENDRVVSGVRAIDVAREVHARRLEEPMMMEARTPLQRGTMGRREMGQTRLNDRR